MPKVASFDKIPHFTLIYFILNTVYIYIFLSKSSLSLIRQLLWKTFDLVTKKIRYVPTYKSITRLQKKKKNTERTNLSLLTTYGTAYPFTGHFINRRKNGGHKISCWTWYFNGN